MVATLTYQSGGVAIAGSLSGNETVVVGNGGPQITTVTTQQIANLVGASSSATVLNTLTSTGATGTISATQIIQKLLARSGPTGNFTDTTAIASAIIALLPASAQIAGTSVSFDYINTTAYIATIQGGSGVTAAGILVVPPFMELRLFLALTSPTAITMTGVVIAESTNTNISMVGSSSGSATIQTPAAAGTGTVFTLPGATDTLAGIGATQTLTNKTITDAIQNGNAVCTTSLSAQTNTVLANVTGLSVTVTAAGTYNLRGHLNGTAAAASGLKIAFSGSATATSSNVTTWVYNGASLATLVNQTTWGSALIGLNTAYTDILFEGSIVVNAGGTITIAAAQNTSGATATTVLVGSDLTVARVS